MERMTKEQLEAISAFSSWGNEWFQTIGAVIGEKTLNRILEKCEKSLRENKA